MAYIYKQNITDLFNMRQISYEVRKYFKTYHFLQKCLTENTIDEILSLGLVKNYDYDTFIQNNRPSDKVWEAVKELNDLQEKMRITNRKIYNLKRRDLTEAERIIFKYSILEDNRDSVVQNLTNLSDNTYKQAKKSCYVKTAIKFNLIKEWDVSLSKMIGLLDH